MDIFSDYLNQIKWEYVVASGIRVFLVILVFWLLFRISKIGLQRLEKILVLRGRREGDMPSEAAKRAETLVRLLRQAVAILLFATLLMIVLRQIGVEIGPVLASAGIIGLAVGFGAQNLVKDVISGFFLILENQVRVGDVAVINKIQGLVEEINFRTVVLRDLSGDVHIFPNGAVTTLSNMTKDWSAQIIEIKVDFRKDLDHAMEIMKRIGSELKNDPQFGILITADVEVLGVDDFTDTLAVIRARIKTFPMRQWEVAREYRRRVNRSFIEEGIR